MSRNQLKAICSVLILGIMLGATPSLFASETETVKDEFWRTVHKKQYLKVYEIPADAMNPVIRMFSKEDTDLRLYEAGDNAATIIGSHRHEKEFDAGNLHFYYTGYMGHSNQSGWETISITGTTSKPLIVKAYFHLKSNEDPRDKAAFKIVVKYEKVSAPTPPAVPVDAMHKPICLYANTDQEGWYWQDTNELIRTATCRDSSEPKCEIFDYYYQEWEASNWKDDEGRTRFSIIQGDINCHSEVGIGFGGERCDDTIKCFTPYHLECRNGLCTNDLIANNEGCTPAHIEPENVINIKDECEADERCVGANFNGLEVVGRCMRHSAFPAEEIHNDCDTDEDCAPGHRCSNFNIPGQFGICYPEVAFYDSSKETAFSSAQNIEINDMDGVGAPGETISYHFVTGLRSVPMTALASLEIEHARPEDLTITAYVPAGVSYQWEYETVLWNRQTGNDGDNRIVLKDVLLNHSGDDRVEGFWVLKIIDNEHGNGDIANQLATTNRLIRWDIKTSSRWD